MSFEATPTAESTPDIEALQAEVERLAEELEGYVGQNLTGDLLVEADAVAKARMDAEQALTEARNSIHRERSTFYEQPPEGYPGNPIIVEKKNKQPLSPAANDNRAPTPDISSLKEAA